MEKQEYGNWWKCNIECDGGNTEDRSYCTVAVAWSESWTYSGDTVTDVELPMIWVQEKMAENPECWVGLIVVWWGNTYYEQRLILWCLYRNVSNLKLKDAFP